MKITSTFFSYKSFALIFVLLTCLMQLQAQTIKVFKSNARYVDLTNGSNMAMPTAAKGTSRDTIYIQNTGASTLNLTGTPLIQITGTNANDFTITVNPATTLGSGSSTYFVITYKPLTTSVSNAVLRILSNSTVNSNFTLNIKGGGTLLYGSLWPPVDGVPPFVSSNNVEAGRPGGRTTTYSQIALAAKTTTWWGPSVDSSGVLQLKLSLDGGTYARDEVFTYVPAESNLNLGKVVWRGVTRIQNAITNSIVTVYTRATLTVTNQDNSVKPLVDPLSIGLSEQVGGLVKIDSALQVFKANYFVEASLNGSTGWTPYLDFYDAYPTPPGPLPGQGVGAAYVTISSGTYWVNNRPRLTNNQILTLDEGTSQVISTAFLNATDLEDMPAYPDSVVFVFRSNTSNNSPLVFQRGVIKRNNTVLNKTDSFTLKDIQNGLISYTHDGSETVYDEFQFSVKDSKKVLAQDGTATIFNFKINIAPVNDAPSTRDTSFNVSYLLSSTKNLVATDPDNANLSFSLVSQGTVGGTLNVQTNGQFTHTPPVGTLPGSSAVFTYRAFDGTSYSNTSSVTLNYMNLPPVTQPLSVRTLEDVAVNGNLSASDPEGSAVSYQLIKNGTKGSVILNANGSFSYQPALTKFGKDYFTYKAADALNNFSAEDTVWVHIIPRMDEGDVIVADKSRIHLFDPATGQDTLIANGGLLSQAQNIFYKKGTSVFVLDQAGGLIKFHPYTGNQTLILGAGSFNNNPGALGITMNNAGKLVIADGPNGIKQVDTLTGGITTLFSGGNIQFPTGVTYLSNGDLLVSDGGIFAGGTSKILRIQPNGTQTVVTSGNLVVLPVDLAVIDQNTIVVADGGSMAGNADRVYKVNLTTGVQTLITTGVNLNFPSGLDYYPKLDKLYVVNQNNAKLLDVNTATGNQTVLSGASSFLTQPFGLLVIGSPIYITSVNVPSNGTYIIGQTLSFQVNFSSAVTVTGSPTLQLTIGSATVNASYVSGSGTTTLTFQYVVQPNEVDTDGIAVNTLGLNGGTITGSGTDADIVLNNVGNTANVLVDGIRPVVDSIKRYNPLSAITGASSVVFRVYFSENVKNIASTAFQLTATGVSGTISNVSSTTGNTVDVTVSGITGNGSLRLDVKNSGTGITDIPGNPLNGGFTSGEQYIINHAPAYTGSAIQTISICAGSAATAVNTLLQTSDTDNGQTLTWSIITGTVQGTVSGLPYSASANGGNIAPAGITYQPPANYSGIDSFKIRVSDGYESDTIEVKVTVIKVNAGFSINSANQCVNENNYVFTNSSNVNSGSLTYSWSFGDGNTSTSANPNHTYATAGTYAVKLVVTSNNGCKDSVTQNVTVYPKPTVNFTIANAAQCLNGNSFSFTNGSSVSTGTISSQWSFGDGNTSTSANPTYTYTTAGTYTVKLVVTTNNGCKDSITKQITVHAKPSVLFTVNNSNQCVNGNSFSFTNGSSVSSGTISSQWSFGDGNTSTSSNPTHTYTTAGTYTVKLVITSNDGCKDSVSQQVTVNPKPTAGFTMNSSAQCINPSNNFVFTNSSTITSGSITSVWSFGDGNTSTSANPNHTYATAGTYAVKLVVTSNNGCKDSVTQNVTVYPKPTVNFTIASSAQCVNGNSFSFTNGSSVSIGTISSQWSFGDGNTSTSANPTYTYTIAGTYTVKLVVTTNNGCKDSITKQVTVYAKPSVSFTVNNSSHCVNGNSFSFTNGSSVSSGTISSQWSFGDGNTSTSSNPTHTYTTAGTYTVKLVVTSNNGCKDSVSQQVTVNPKPTAGFTTNSSAQCINPSNNFVFTNSSTITSGSITSAWSFGDGNTSASANPNHTYATAGTYAVKLVVTSNNGCKDSVTQNVTVYPKPTVNFTIASSAQCLNGNSFSFTNGSSVSTGTISSQWSFGDGNTSTSDNPTYTYTAAGTYTVKLVVTTNNGCKDSITKQVTVYAKPSVSFTVNNSSQCVNGNSFSFTNGSSVSSGTISSQWSFGDGNTSTSTNPTHTYTTAGIYTVKLVVTSNNGCKDSVSQQVTVNPKPTAGFTMNSSAQCINPSNNFVFTNSSTITSGSITSVWSFGDGNTSTSANPNHTYATAGTYAVKLVVTSNNGCKDSVTQNVTVYPKPTVNFTISNTAQCLNGNSFVFTNGSSVSTGTISSQWNFGDGNTSTSANPTYTYTAAGTYTVKLVVTTNNGCKDSITKQVTVYAKPSVSFTVNNSSQCVNGNSFSFTNSSSVSSGTISSQWSFGDGNTSTSSNPTHTYTTAGTYSVKLVVTSNNGCKDSVSQQVTVNPKPTAGFTMNSSAQCINPSNNFVFTNSSTITLGSITSAWSFGDGNTSTSANPNHTYTTAGTYAVKLVVTSNNGCKDSVTQNITVYPKPVPDFTVNGNTTQCLAGNSFSFNNATILSTGTFTSLWNFGDGKTATTLNATHVYTTAGTYTVKLIVTSSNGCKDSILKTVTVLAKPTVAFTVNDNTQCINGNQFVFTNNSSVSTGAFTSNWSFGDGGTASSANATYSYSASGNYTVKLVISSIANGCKDSISQVVSVFAKPTVGFTVNNAAQCLNGNNFSFTNTGTISSGTFTSAWNFGDGITAATKNAAHIYTASGIYPVKLVLTSNYGCKDSIISNITVHSKPVVSFTVNNNAQCINGNSFVFTNNSSVSAGSISSQWFFGNGANANTSNATYTYPIHGNYTVKLVVATDNACKDSTTQPVTVFAKPNPSFTVNDADQCLKGNSFSFSNKSNIATGSYTSAWSFGDGNGSGTTNAVYTYAAANTYTVKLVLTSNNGCKDSMAQTVNVYSHPVAGFDVNDAVQCLNNNSFAFVNTTTPSTGNTYKWSFGDGGSSSLSDPDYAYNKADTFTVWMYALSSNNCKSDTVKKTMVTVAHPVVKLGPDRTVLEGDSIILSPQSFSGIDLHFKWTPNSFLNNDTIPAPVATPQTDMNYRLTVIGQEGCTASDDIFVKLLKYPLIPNAFSPNGDGINDKWIISYLNDYPNATVEIFDRSGRIVFRASAGYNTSIAWDGRSDGKPLPVGTYYYIIEPKNGRARITGYITLLR